MSVSYARYESERAMSGGSAFAMRLEVGAAAGTEQNGELSALALDFVLV